MFSDDQVSHNQTIISKKILIETMQCTKTTTTTSTTDGAPVGHSDVVETAWHQPVDLGRRNAICVSIV